MADGERLHQRIRPHWTTVLVSSSKFQVSSFKVQGSRFKDQGSRFKEWFSGWRGIATDDSEAWALIEQPLAGALECASLNLEL
jgi:hypothetical protein